MMYRCENCGHLFEEGEQAVWEERHGLDTPPYEKWDGCPVCGDGYQEVFECSRCGKWHAEEKLYKNWCKDCLIKTINYFSFFDYCEHNKKENYLEIFMLLEFMGGMDCPKTITAEFHELMINEFNKRVVSAKKTEAFWGNERENGFLDKCIRFIMDDDGSIGRENYADWLNKREVKTNA